MELSSNVSTDSEGVLPFEMDHLPDLVLKKCEEELNETSEKKTKVLALRYMIEDDDIVSGINFEEDFLVQYLRHSKYDVNKALKHIRNYVNLRKKRSYMFESLPDNLLSEQLSNNFLSIMPKRSPDGCVIVLLQVGKWNLKQLSFDKFMQLNMMLYTQLLRDEMNQINGIRAIYDCKGTSFAFLQLCKPQNLYIYNHLLVNCLPTRVKGLHIINESFVVRLVWPVMKQLMSEKLRNRVHFHSNSGDLFEYFPPHVLPTQYNGELSDTHLEEGLSWIRKVNNEHKDNPVEGQPNFY
ncbi:alpha-tocopherol transfer protein-like [Nephila pilipes]|uniref:Alpha-tocopherol transfer protein-like n=1 Tax=Nephila pilipes TaxID=299642 RepID=A0A8X6QHA9_NEPPI|nr:alpha-tocopherol transfer protein-like [Nephila pilipes]